MLTVASSQGFLPSVVPLAKGFRSRSPSTVNPVADAEADRAGRGCLPRRRPDGRRSGQGHPEDWTFRRSSFFYGSELRDLTPRELGAGVDHGGER